MQINSNWSQTFGEEWWSTLGDPCTNIKAGARILALCMKKYGYNWEAIGCYNSQTPGKRNKYALAVFKQLQRNERDDRQNASKSIKDALEDKPPGHVENSANAGQSRDGENHPVSQAQTLPDDLLEASIPDTEE